MNHSVATIISYCTNDFRFLDLCIHEAKQFSSQIIVVISDHFFNGEPENQDLLEASAQRHPDCLFIEFAYKENEPYGLYCPVTVQDEDWAHYWHSSSRYIGFHFLNEEIETVLFADVDEVPDGKRFSEWLDGFDYRAFDAIRLASYFYFRSASLRALSWLPGSLVVKKRSVQSEILLDLWERQGVFNGLGGKKMQMGVGVDGDPLTHHFSWVKTKEEMLLKARSWGHGHERNWGELIEKEFSAPFSGIDNFYGLKYEEVSPWRDPLQAVPFTRSEGTAQNKLKLDRSSFFRFTILKKKP